MLHIFFRQFSPFLRFSSSHLSTLRTYSNSASSLKPFLVRSVRIRRFISWIWNLRLVKTYFLRCRFLLYPRNVHIQLIKFFQIFCQNMVAETRNFNSIARILGERKWEGESDQNQQEKWFFHGQKAIIHSSLNGIHIHSTPVLKMSECLSQSKFVNWRNWFTHYSHFIQTILFIKKMYNMQFK